MRLTKLHELELHGPQITNAELKYVSGLTELDCPASRYTADMSKHYALGSDARLVKENLEFAEKL